MSFANLIKKNPNAEKIRLGGGICEGYVERKHEKIFIDKYKPSLKKGSELLNKNRKEIDRAYYEETMARRRQQPVPVERPDVTLDLGPEQGGSQVFELDELTSVGTMSNLRELTREELTQVYQRYSFKPLQVPSHLKPIHDDMETILQLIESNSVCIIKGPTGCGKSTQIPQFILDHYVKKTAHCNIIVTQPRRIAAITLAQHICELRGWTVGELVGYQVGLDKCANENTRLLYCTTGVLLEKLIGTKNLNDYTHIILDEVHEREEDMDFAMLVIKDFLRTNSPNVKVILMSATLEASRFSKYFEILLPNGQFMPAPSYEIKRESKFSVATFYLDDLYELVAREQLPEHDIDTPEISPEVYKMIQYMLAGFKKIDKADYDKRRCTQAIGAVLVFLPGLQQIEYLHDMLDKHDKEHPGVNMLWLCPLHSSITRDEQSKVQQLAPAGMRKVILSTNIAESSLTIPDVKYVIDFCLTKHLVADPNTGFSSLQLAWASHNNCEQRKGRAGRVMDGRLYRMVRKSFYKTQMQTECVPEMQRCPLEIIVLKCKKLFDNKCPLRLISTALDPPDLTNYEKTIVKLKEIGGLLVTCRGKLDPLDGDLTFVGKVMGSLPLDIRITKLILLGHAFDVLEEAIVMGCAMSVRNVFSEPFRKKLEAYNNRLLWADASESDPIAYLNCYMVWREMKAMGRFSKHNKSENMWANKYMVQIKHLYEVAKQEADITRRLRHFNITVVRHQNKPLWTNNEKPLILKLVLAGAFYPLYYSRKPQDPHIEQEAMKQLMGRDPLSCVYIQNIPLPVPLYLNDLRNLLTNNGISNDISFATDDTRKVVVEFNTQATEGASFMGRKLNPDIPGDIKMPVYRAVKLRQLSGRENYKLVLTIKNVKQLEDEARKLNLGSGSSMMSLTSIPETKFLPIEVKTLAYYEVEVTHVEDPGHFYCHLTNIYGSELSSIFFTLNRQEGVLGPLSGDIVDNLIYAAPYKDDSDEKFSYYRARVKRKYKKNEKWFFEVFFIDYGNTESIEMSNLLEIVCENAQEHLNKYPPMAVECVLTEVGPSLWIDVGGKWSKEATEYVKKVLLQRHEDVLPDGTVQYRGNIWFVNVYSYVHGVASVVLYLEEPKTLDPDESEETWTLNKELVKLGYARQREESIISKMNHAERQKKRQKLREEEYAGSCYSFGSDDASSKNGDRPYSLHQSLRCTTLDPNNLQRTTSFRPAVLKGPNSPLEMKLFSLVYCSTSKEVRVEGNSVNSVLLDSDPCDRHERILVAGSVSQSEDGRQLTLNSTTVLPNMEGLAGIVCLAFAPTVEIRTDRNFSRYTGALCGLGVDEDGESIFPENDMEIIFDVAFSEHDLININRLRWWLNERFCNEDAEQLDDGQVLKILSEIRDFTKALLRTRRQSMPVQFNQHTNFWGLLPDEMCLDPLQDKADSDDYQLRNIYRLHKAPQVDPQNDRDEVIGIIADLEKVRAGLDSSSGRTDNDRSAKGKMYCPLCDIHFDYWSQLSLHMVNRQHFELEGWLESRAQAHNIPFKRERK